MNEGSEIVKREKKLTLWGVFLAWLEKKACHHEWKLEQTLESSYSEKYFLYTCKKCGKWEKIRLKKTY